jgi:hypothetical protein
MRFLYSMGRVDVQPERRFDIRVPEHLAQAFHIDALLDAARGVSMPQRVEIPLLKSYFFSRELKRYWYVRGSIGASGLPVNT